MLDLYSLPRDTLGLWVTSDFSGTKTQRIATLYEAMASDIGHARFLPYIQLHEFETLLLVDPETLAITVNKPIANAQELVKSLGTLSPEEVNERSDGAPSHRIECAFPGYEKRKASIGPNAAKHIGLPKLRAECPNSNHWLIECLAQ